VEGNFFKNLQFQIFFLQCSTIRSLDLLDPNELHKNILQSVDMNAPVQRLEICKELSG